MKKCPVCNSEVQGRTDRVFCSSKCKSAHQYEKRLENEDFYLRVDKQLKLNRKLLKQHNRTGLTTLRQSVLLDKGFNPKFFTHYWKNGEGQVYLFCYDYGFVDVNKNDGVKRYTIVEWQEYMSAKINL